MTLLSPIPGLPTYSEQNAAKAARNDFDATVRTVFIQGHKSMRLGIAGGYLFHKNHSAAAIKKMLDLAKQDFKAYKGDLYSALFTYVANDINTESDNHIPDVSVWATQRANCCRQLAELDNQKNTQHFKNADVVASFIKEQRGMIAMGETYKANQKAPVDNKPASNDNNALEENRTELLLAAVKRLPHHLTDYTPPDTASGLFVLLAERDAKGNASIIGTLPMDAGSLEAQIEELIQGSQEAVSADILNLHRLARLSEVFGANQILIGEGGKTALIPQTRTNQSHKKAENTARIFVSLKEALPVSGELVPKECKALCKALKSRKNLHRTWVAANQDGSSLVVKSGKAKSEIELVGMSRSASHLVKAKSDATAAQFTVPAGFLSEVVEAEEAKQSATSSITIASGCITIGDITSPTGVKTLKSLTIRQSLLTKTFSLLAELTDNDITVRLYDLLDDISFHIIDEHGDFAIELTGFGEV
jgi:hypothetical protein